MSLRWGICGTGSVATLMARTLNELGREVVAVGSREQGTADVFGEEHGIPRRYAPYSVFLGDAVVDVVYIATPANTHVSLAVAALVQGHHVLVEKPFADAYDGATFIEEAAADQGRFAMEAMWSRCLPAYEALRALLLDGRIGEVRMVEASFGQRAEFAPEQRPFRVDLGGGALYDAGPYPIQLAHLVLGEPDRVEAVGEIGQSGVDEQAGFLLGYETGQCAVLSCAITTTLAGTARVSGTDGWIVLPSVAGPPYLDVYAADGTLTRVDALLDRPRLAYEIEEVERCIAAGLSESPLMPLAESCAIARTIDRARAQIGAAT